MDVKSTWTPTWHQMDNARVYGHLDYFPKPPLGGRPNTKPLGDHGMPNAHNCWYIIFYHAWGPAWIEIHWNNISVDDLATYDFTLHLRARDHTTWLWKCLGTAFGWALTFSWSRLLARVWSGPRFHRSSFQPFVHEGIQVNVWWHSIIPRFSNLVSQSIYLS